jgi:predicted component of type VI protein secretion system
MAAFLVPLDPGQTAVPLEKTILLIGRQSDCDVTLTRSKKVSRRHCCIAQVNSHFLIRDLGSTNGVFVNGSRISTETRLRLGDDVTIGDVRFRIESQPVSKEAKAPTGGAAKPPKGSKRPRPSAAAPPSLEIPVAIPESDDAVPVADSGPIVPYAERDSSDIVPLSSDSVF